ncbi:MAG: bL17 family ribosomal protein [Collinsella sp.]
MKKSLVNALFLNDRIKTVESRAKEIRPSRAIRSSRGPRRATCIPVVWLSPSSGRQRARAEIFEKAAQGMWQDRNGGYTRIMKLGNRKGDNAPIVIMELVTEPCTPKAKKAAPAPKKAAAPKKVEAVEEAPAEETAE